MASNGSQDVEYLDRLRAHTLSASTSNSKIWKRTNSRVGEIIKAPKPSCAPHFLRYSISSTGIRNARVFPLPVRAAPSTSLPFNDMGKLFAWISVISTNEAFLRPIKVKLFTLPIAWSTYGRASFCLVGNREVCKGFQVLRWFLQVTDILHQWSHDSKGL